MAKRKGRPESRRSFFCAAIEHYRKKDWWKSAVSAVRSRPTVLNELGDKARNGEQDENMNAAALMQQNLQDEPDNHSECARNPEHRVIMLRKL
jgi:hypothetical protein